MQEKLRRPKAMVAVAVAALLLGACGGGGGNGDSSGTKDKAAGNLLIWFAEGPAGEAIQDAATEFGKELGVNVTVELLPGEEMQGNFVTASQANNAPDIVFGAHDWIGNMVQNGTIDPIVLPATVRKQLQPLAVKGVTFNARCTACRIR